MNIKSLLPIVEKKNRIFDKIVKFSLILSFFSLLYLLFIYNNQFWKNISLFLFLFFFVIEALRKKNDVVGTIILTSNQIIVNRHGKDIVFSITDLNRIEIKLLEFEGGIYKFNPQAIVVKDGTNNFLKFYFKEEKFSFQLLISKNELDGLNEVFDSWKTKNIDFVLIDDV